MKIYNLTFSQFVPASLDQTWDFFSDPANLKTLTPAYMGFDVISGGDVNMYAGQIITYKVRPILNFPLTWVTEITHVDHHNFFVDEQRFGPYKFWHHQHHFKVEKNGTTITDIVHFVLPFGIFGRIMSSYTRKKLRGIFQYRKETIEKLFPAE